MNVHETKIEWATHTWNPVTGCRHNCDYCYARRQIRRFEPKATERPVMPLLEDAPGCYRVNLPTPIVDAAGNRRVCQYPAGFAPTIYPYKLDQPERRLTPSRIFVSSMGDLFGSWVPDAWIDEVFEACKRAPQHNYLFLTKNPQRYIDFALEGRLPDAPEFKNFWYGTTVTDPSMPFFYHDKANVFVSMEPLLEPFKTEDCIDALEDVGWLIIGGMTGPGSKNRQPRREWVEEIVEIARDVGVPVFMKDNLEPTWGPDLIREHPAGMLWPEEGHHG